MAKEIYFKYNQQSIVLKNINFANYPKKFIIHYKAQMLDICC